MGKEKSFTTRNDRLKTILLLVLGVVLPINLVFAEFSKTHNPVREYSGQTIFDLENVPEENIDIGLWALVIAKEYDSSLQIDDYLSTLDSMASQIQLMVGPRDGDMVRFMMTKMFQYDSGEWNNSEPYSYDLADPLGDNPRNKLLSTYLDNKTGNCVSMPTLFLALMERVDPDIPFNGVMVPGHLFCRFHERGKIWNVETTNGGHANRDVWYIERMHVPQFAIDSGTYMTDMTKKAYVIELIEILVNKCRLEANYDKGLEYTDLMLKLNPKSISGLVLKGALLAWKGQIILDKIMGEVRQPSMEEHEKLLFYKNESDKFIARAKSLGWNPESEKSREEYLRTITEEKSRRNK